MTPSPRLLAIFALSATGCYTTHNVATLSPLDTSYPVSASGQYVDSAGAIVDEEGYVIQRPFEFEKTVSAPRHESTEAPIELRAELDRLLESNHGDAITHLKVQAIRYDSGSHTTAANWKILGWCFGLSGGTFLAVGAATDRDAVRAPLVATGAIFAGLGVLSFLAGSASTEPASWQFKVTGQVVKSGVRAAQPVPVKPASLPSPPVAPASAAPAPAAPITPAPVAPADPAPAPTPPPTPPSKASF